MELVGLIDVPGSKGNKNEGENTFGIFKELVNLIPLCRDNLLTDY
jgi:hypothetical protein